MKLLSCKDLLKSIDNLFIEKLDVTDVVDQNRLMQKYNHITLDILINNAGIYPEHHRRIRISDTNPNW